MNRGKLADYISAWQEKDKVFNWFLLFLKSIFISVNFENMQAIDKHYFYLELTDFSTDFEKTHSDMNILQHKNVKQQSFQEKYFNFRLIWMFSCNLFPIITINVWMK